MRRMNHNRLWSSGSGKLSRHAHSESNRSERAHNGRLDLNDTKRETIGLSVIVATYEWPEALDAVLAAISEQHDPRFEVIVRTTARGPRLLPSSASGLIPSLVAFGTSGSRTTVSEGRAS